MTTKTRRTKSAARKSVKNVKMRTGTVEGETTEDTEEMMAVMGVEMMEGTGDRTADKQWTLRTKLSFKLVIQAP